jgi:hypothetical protein
MNPLHSLMEEEAVKQVNLSKKRNFEDSRPHVLATDSLTKYRNDPESWITCIYRKLLASKRSLVELLYEVLGLPMDGFDSKLDLVWGLRDTTLFALRDLIEVFFASRELPLLVDPSQRWVSSLSSVSGGR